MLGLAARKARPAPADLRPVYEDGNASGLAAAGAPRGHGGGDHGACEHYDEGLPVDLAGLADGRRKPPEPVVAVPQHRPTELPCEAPEPVARAEGTDEMVDRPFRQRRLETLRVTDDPRSHIAAVRAAEHAEPLGVEERESLERGVDDANQVLVVDRAPAGTRVVARAAHRAAPRPGPPPSAP